MKALADYVHSKGLKFGIYTTPGPVSCSGYVGSHGHEVEDAQTFADWGVDFVMNDVCSAGFIYRTLPELQALHQKMAEALRATGRPNVYKVHDAINVAEWIVGGNGTVESWGREVGANLWRVSLDLCAGDRWKSVSVRFERHGKPEDAGPGGWNDSDILVIGLNGIMPGYRALTIEEFRTHMTLWSILASPLILGNDVRVMTPEVKGILLNKEVIAIDQDALGKQGRRIVRNGSSEIWVKPLSDGSTVVALFNRGATGTRVSVSWSDLGLQGAQRVRDLWQHADLGEHLSGYSAMVQTHGSVLLRVQASERT
jgi:alpha-galactosidase